MTWKIVGVLEISVLFIYIYVCVCVCVCVGVLGPGAHYLHIYWAWDPIWGREVVRGGVDIAREVSVNKWRI